MALTVEDLLPLLAATPDRLESVTAAVAPGLLRTPPAPAEWSANEVLAHLRACADVWGDCIRRILAEDEPTIRAVNPRTWIRQTNYPDLEFQPSLRSFIAQRASLLAVLNPLPPADWARSATVTGGGAPLQLTALNYADRLARHERAHVKQIARTVAAVTA